MSPTFIVYTGLCVHVSTCSDGMASVNQNADVLTITFMLYAMPKHRIFDVESMPHAVWLYSVPLETMHYLSM